MTTVTRWGLSFATAFAACVPDAGRQDRATEAYLRILEIEDARAEGESALASLLAAAEARDAFLRRTALRALGRLEDPGVVAPLAAHLDDPDPAARATAVWALAQSVHGARGGDVLDLLLALIPEERDTAVRAALARAVGRLTLDPADRRRAFEAQLALSGPDPAAVPRETLVGVALGLESLVRGQDGAGIAGRVAERLEHLAVHGLGEDDVWAARIRALALSALGPPRRIGFRHIDRALSDPDAEVRRSAVSYLGSVVPSERSELIRRALADPSPRVAIEAIDYLAAAARTPSTCEHMIDAAHPDRTPALRVRALEALSRGCPSLGAARRAVLVEAASELEPAPTSTWQPAARALATLARFDSDAAGRLLPRFTEHESAFVRLHAARVAATLDDSATLRTLVRDVSPNVRAAALRGLFALRSHAIDDLLVAQLEEDDPWLLLTAAELLQGAPEARRVARAAVAAFVRLTAAERETARDPRRALLALVADLGDASLVEELEPYVRDYDPLVARDVAELLVSWTGRPHEPDPRPLPPARSPTPDELEALTGATLTLTLQGGRRLVIETRPDVALTNVFRTVRLARSGYYDGLTFHRWAPNFVIQGGSPGANEYAGARRYTRDEIGGLSHWRGAVGVSTRGRDTGDGQIFINLVHNVRLDPDYTVLGRVVEGLDVLDSVLEGTVIERAEVR